MKLMKTLYGNEHLQKMLNDKRIAFLMAWHQRLGQNAIISKHINKDVAKLIAKKYITLKSQLIKKGNYEQDNQLLLSRKKDFAIQVQLMVKKIGQLFLLEPMFITPNLIGYKNVYVQMPEMFIPYTQTLLSLQTGYIIPKGGSTKIQAETLGKFLM